MRPGHHAVLALPDPSTVPARFEEVTEPAEGIERLVREAFAIYERGAPHLRAIAARATSTHTSRTRATRSRRR